MKEIKSIDHDSRNWRGTKIAIPRLQSVDVRGNLAKEDSSAGQAFQT